MQSYQWWQIRLKGRKGSEAQTQVPFLDDLLIAYSENTHASQLLKIEIKGRVKSHSCNALAGLKKRVLSHLFHSQFIASSQYIELLICLRTANPDAYLGVVVDTHQDSIGILSMSHLDRVFSVYDRFKGVSASKKFYVKNNNRSHLIRTSFADVRRFIGPYYSFYIDCHDYWTFALNYSKAQGCFVFYQLDNYAGQVVLLNEIRQQKKILTNSVLVDTDLEPYGVLRNTL